MNATLAVFRQLTVDGARVIQAAQAEARPEGIEPLESAARSTVVSSTAVGDETIYRLLRSVSENREAGYR